MPQMMPLNWTLLFIFFIMIFILFNIMNYYIHLNKPNIFNKFLLKSSNMNWKW